VQRLEATEGRRIRRFAVAAPEIEPHGDDREKTYTKLGVHTRTAAVRAAAGA
jgi:hypothetical protein